MLLPRLFIVVVLAVYAPLALAQGEIIVVDDSPDVADFGGAQTVADLPGPDGRVTLREAVTAANNTPGPQTIHFNIPQDRWWTLFDDQATVFSYSSPFLITDDSLTIDGRSQTAFTGDTNPDGNEVVFWGEHPNSLGSPMFYVFSDHNSFIGLDAMHRRGEGIFIAASAEHNRVIGNTISGPLYAAVHIEGSHNVVGGTEPGEGNWLSSGNAGVRVQSVFSGSEHATANRIIGNRLTGRVAGIQIRAEAYDTVVGGPTPEERNVIAGAGYFGEHSSRIGEQMLIQDSFGTLVEGNYIGTNEAGTAAASQVAAVGIEIRDSDNTTLRGNLIGGILPGSGVQVLATSDGTTIVGNRFGTTADGTGAIPSGTHIYLSSYIAMSPPVNTSIGGTAPGDGNVVAHATARGVYAALGATSPTGVSILGNAFFENGDVGIDLGTTSGADGATPNDPGDADEGPNRYQNHPVIEAAVLDGTTLRVTYSVDTDPANATYPFRIEFFEADAGRDEGERLLGADTYTVSDYPGTRAATLDVTGSGLTTGAFMLGTATDDAGNTSEFGAPIEITGGNNAVAVSASPMSAPVVIPSGGGAFEFVVTLANATAETQTFQAWSEATGPVHHDPVLAPRSVTLRPGQAVLRTLRQQVPSGAPAGVYSYAVHIGSHGESVMASSSFAVEKEGLGIGQSRSGDTGEGAVWSVRGWEDEAVAVGQASRLAEGFALSAVYPNPVDGRARFTLEVAAAQRVTVAVFDALGRRVAVPHDGLVEGGMPRSFALDAGRLPGGVYLLQVSGETFAVSRRFTLLR